MGKGWPEIDDKSTFESEEARCNLDLSCHRWYVAGHSGPRPKINEKSRTKRPAFYTVNYKGVS